MTETQKKVLKLVGFTTATFCGVSYYFQRRQSRSMDVLFDDIKETEKSFATSQNYFKFAASNIPHPSKVHKGGEDAWVASPNVLALADGVGGWESQGVDSGLFSKQLVSDIKKVFDLNEAAELKQVLVDTVAVNPHTGSSTCVMAKFDTGRKDRLKTTNLGDSGYVLIRPHPDGKLEKLYRSKEQQYSFNFPYQCGTNCDPPYAANDREHQIQENDVIVLGTDGVFDNVYDEDILECIKPSIKGVTMEMPQKASDCVAQLAAKMGVAPDYRSPFAKNAQEQGLNYPNRGKVDDITVVTAQIFSKSAQSQEQEISTNGTGLKEYIQNQKLLSKQ